MEQARNFFYFSFNIPTCNFFYQGFNILICVLIWVSTYPYAFVYGLMFVVEEEGRTQFGEKRKNEKRSKIVDAENRLIATHYVGNR